MQRIQPIKDTRDIRKTTSRYDLIKLIIKRKTQRLSFDKKVEAYKEPFTGTHDATEVDANAIPHSSHLNSSYGGLGQAQYVAHIISSVKIFLKALNQGKNKWYYTTQEVISQVQVTFSSRIAFASSTFKTTPPSPCSKACINKEQTCIEPIYNLSIIYPDFVPQGRFVLQKNF